MKRFVSLLVAVLLWIAGDTPAAETATAGTVARPFRIYAITYRGQTDVERGFADYFAQRGVPVEITYRDIALDPKRLPGLVNEIRRTRPDLICTWGTPVTLGIAGPWDKADPDRHVTDVPIVFTVVASPVSARIVADLKAPARNVTGVSHVAATEAQMQAMSAYRPFRKLGMVYTPTEPNSRAVLAELQELGQRQGFGVEARPFRLDAAGRPTAEGTEELVRELKGAGAEWLYLPPDTFLNQQARDRVLPAAAEAGLPTFAATEALMTAGALAGLVSRYYNVGQFAGYKAEQILVHKIPPGRIPVETLSRFSLQINLPAARRLGLLPPLAMFNYAEFLAAESVPPLPQQPRP
jgi:putative tryptophan/tyrosine transport system substrate-binding protein